MIFSTKTITHAYIALFFFSLILGCASTQSGNLEKAQALEKLGGSHYNQGDLREALRYLLQANQLDPENPNLHHELAIVYRDLNEYEMSLNHFKKALNLKPQFPEAWNDMGLLYVSLNEWDTAIEYFQKAANDILYKTPDRAYNDLGLAYYHKRDYQRAIENYQKALKIFSSSRYCVNLGLVYEALTQWEKAVETYKTSMQYDRTDPAPYLRLGSLYDRLNRKAEAVSTLKKFLDTVKEGPGVAEVQELLKKIQG